MKKWFTLIELLIVVVIIWILAVSILPRFMDPIKTCSWTIEKVWGCSDGGLCWVILTNWHKTEARYPVEGEKVPYICDSKH